MAECIYQITWVIAQLFPYVSWQQMLYYDSTRRISSTLRVCEMHRFDVFVTLPGSSLSSVTLSSLISTFFHPTLEWPASYWLFSPTISSFVSEVSRFPGVLLCSTPLPSFSFLPWSFQFNSVISFLPEMATQFLTSTNGATTRMERWKGFLVCQNVLVTQLVGIEHLRCCLFSLKLHISRLGNPSPHLCPYFLYWMFLKLCFPDPWDFRDVFWDTWIPKIISNVWWLS